jgi:hypothetical protein
MQIYIGITYQCRAKMGLLFPKSGLKKLGVKVNFFIASVQKLKTYGVGHR